MVVHQVVRGNILGVLLFILGSSTAQVITLDTSSDTSSLWTDNSCHYNNVPEDFWVYGCPLNTPDSLDPTGYWTNCKTTTCDVTFNAGYLPKAKKLSVRAYIEGTPKIFILGKLSHDDIPFYLPIGNISSSDGTAQWEEVTFDLPQPVSALKLSLGSSGGYVLLDWVTIDLGNETPEMITLDTEVQKIPSHWPIDTCTSVKDYREYRYYGCPVELEGTVGSGFWSPCVQSSCQLTFYSDSNVHPSAVVVRGYLSGSGEIRVVSKPSPKSVGESVLVQVINVENTGAGWNDVEIDLSGYLGHTVVVVELVGSSGSLALLDSVAVAVCISNGSNDPPTCVPTTSPTVAPPSDSTDDPTDPGSTTPPSSTVGPSAPFNPAFILGLLITCVVLH